MNIRKLYTVLRLLLLLPAIMLAATSCLKEDGACHDGTNKVRIIVRTIAEVTRADAPLGQIDNIVIYVFDENRRFAGSWQGDRYTYGQKYVAELDIEPGTYDFVVWTNQGTDYDKTIPSYGTNDPAEALVVAMKYPSDGKITQDITDLHHGILTGAEVIENRDNEFLIVLTPNTYKLNFTVEGLRATGDEYTFSVTDNHLQFAFDNTVVEQKDNEVEYLRRTQFDGPDLGASMTVLKIMEGRATRFDFTDITTGDILHSDDLVQMIKKAYAKAGNTVDFNNEFEFDIVLKFDARLNVTISVNGWTYNPNEGILG